MGDMGPLMAKEFLSCPVESRSIISESTRISCMEMFLGCQTDKLIKKAHADWSAWAVVMKYVMAL